MALNFAPMWSSWMSMQDGWDRGDPPYQGRTRNLHHRPVHTTNDIASAMRNAASDYLMKTVAAEVGRRYPSQFCERKGAAFLPKTSGRRRVRELAY